MLKTLYTLLAVMPFAGHAALMTFSGIVPGELDVDRVYEEDGITANYAGLLRSLDGGAYFEMVHMPAVLRMDFTTGSLFSATSIDIRPLGSDYCAAGGSSEPVIATPESCVASSYDDPIAYIWASGFLGGVLTNTFGFYSPRSEDFSHLSLAALGSIDMLRIDVRNYFDLGLTGACGPNSCGRFLVDNVQLTSVPEPETFGLFAMGLLGAWLSRRRRRAN